MKQYIKPQSEVQDIVCSTIMQTTSLGVNSIEKDNVDGDAKQRDVWSEGFWN